MCSNNTNSVSFSYPSSSESFAREWDRGGRFDWLPELSIPGRGHADFSLEGFVKGYSRFIAEKLCDLFYLDIVLEQAGCSVHAPMSEIRDRGLTDRKSTRLNSSHGYISYAVFCLKKKT